MYNTTHIGIPESSIAKEHWRVLEHAVAHLEDADPRHGDVYRALEYFQARSNRQGAINLLWAGLRTGNRVYLRDGLARLRQHLGSVVP